MSSILLVLSTSSGMLGGLSDLSDLDDIKEAVDNEVWLLWNPWSREGERN